MVTHLIKHEQGEILEWKWASDNELIPSPFFASVYFVDGLLIDAGPPAGVKDFREFITSLLDTHQIKACVITHLHEDHCGGAHLLQEEFNILIYAPEGAIEKLKTVSTYPQYRQITWGDRRLPVDAKKIPDVITTKSGKYAFEIIPLPGHAPEQVGLLEKNQEWFFATDAIQPKYKMLFGGSSDIQEDISEIYNTIKTLHEYTEGMDNLKIFLSGPGVFEGRVFLKEKMNEIESLHRKVHRIYKEESKNHEDEEKILRKVLKGTFRRETAIGKLTQGDLSIMNLIKSLLKWPLTD